MESQSPIFKFKTYTLYVILSLLLTSFTATVFHHHDTVEESSHCSICIIQSITNLPVLEGNATCTYIDEQTSFIIIISDEKNSSPFHKLVYSAHAPPLYFI